MTEKLKLETAIYEAFLAAGKQLGAKTKGMSCLVHNWKAHAPSAESEKQAA